MEGIHQRMNQFLKGAAERQIANQRRKLKIDRQGHPATMAAEGYKLPGTVQLLERAIGQAHLDMVRGAPLIDRGEGLLEPSFFQGQLGAHAVAAAVEHFGAGAAGQEFRVTLDIIGQREHLFGAERQNGFPVNTRHVEEAISQRHDGL